MARTWELQILFFLAFLPCALFFVVLVEFLSSLAVRALQRQARANFCWPSESIFHTRRRRRLPTDVDRFLAVTRYKSSPTTAAAAVADEKKQLQRGSVCVFCLADVEEDEEIRELRCRHLFHRDCLDGWLERKHLTCPVCRDDLVAGKCKSALLWPEIDNDEVDIDGTAADGHLDFLNGDG